MSHQGSRPAGGPVLIHRVIGRLNVGGPAQHVVNLARALDDGERFRTRLIAGVVPESEGDMEYYAAERDVKVTRIPEMSRELSLFDDVSALVRLVELFRDERPHVVHTHTAKAGALGRVAAAVARVPVRVHTFHGHVLGGEYFGPRTTSMYRQIERQLARLTDRLVVLTDGQKRELSVEHDVAPQERFRVVPLGLELDPFVALDREVAGVEARVELGLPPDAPVVGVVGRLVPIKNHELLLRALASIRWSGSRASRATGRDLSGTRLLVVGGGAREGELREVADELGVGDAVTWAGWRTSLPRLYAAMDVLALTSRDEGTPVAIIEALAAGTPVVALGVGGVPSLLKGVGAAARLVAGTDADDVADALGDTLARAEGPSSGADARGLRVRVARHFAVDRLARDLAGLYCEELERKGLPSCRGSKGGAMLLP